MHSDLSEHERYLTNLLPGPPATTTIRASNIWIIEWLSGHDLRTGKALHEWMLDQRQGWSAYFPCRNKNELFAAIEKAHAFVCEPNFSPVLHIEAHGNESGLVGPNGEGGMELLSWGELTPHLQKLNLATGCNLVFFVAACIGFGGIQALASGPRAPAVALVGPDANVCDSDLLRGTKEFYRRWQDPKPGLTEVSESASREMVGVGFEVEPFVLMAYEAHVALLVRSLRPWVQMARKDKLRERLLAETSLSVPEINAQLSQMSPILPWQQMQRTWDEMFMLDVFPGNRARFGVDWEAIYKQLILGVRS